MQLKYIPCRTISGWLLNEIVEHMWPLVCNNSRLRKRDREWASDSPYNERGFSHKGNRDARNCKRGESSVLVHVSVLLTLVLDKTVVSFMPRPLYPRRRGSQYPSDTAWLAKQAWNQLWKKKKTYPCQKLKNDSSLVQSVAQSLFQLSYFGRSEYFLWVKKLSARQPICYFTFQKIIT